MKHKLLFLLLILFSFQNTLHAQTPCGITELTACDDDTNGLAIFDITIFDNIYPFCVVNANASDYYAPTHHLTQADADTGANPIMNPETFESSNGQFIFMRAEPLNSGTHSVLAFQTFELIFYCADPSFYMTPTCDGATATITGDVGGYFNFNQTPSDGIVIDSVTGTATGGVSGATYCVEYTLSGTNPISSIECFTIPLITGDASFFMTPTCDGGIATITGDSGGMFSFSSSPTDSAEIDTTTGAITGGTYGTQYAVRYTTGSGLCPDSSVEYVTAECTDAIGFIEVNAFIDENSNGVFDASEVHFDGGEFTYEINNNGVIFTVNSNSGSFIVAILEEGDSYDISFTMDDIYNSCLSQTNFLIENITATNGETVQVNFPLTQLDDCNDIAVYVLSNGSPRPGFAYSNLLIIENLGFIPVSGSVEFTLDTSVTFEGVYNVDAGNTVTNTATGFVLNFNDLQPNTVESVLVLLEVPTTANSGDIITNSAIYNVDDFNLDNNQSTLTQTVVNSYDPNDKMESHGPEIKFDDFTNEDYLFYTIRFQNLGTAEAIDISIEDVLDTQLDVSTFKMLHASHDYVLTRVDNNLTWEFEGIDLPSESMDEPNSHGFVYFKIKPNSGFQIGNVIPNYADIYFDFNPAVTTNTFETEFVANLSVEGFNSIQFSMYPNPANEIVNVEFNTNVSNNINIHIFDLQGKLVLNSNSESESNGIQLNISNLSKGMYFVELIGSDFKIIEKLIVE